MNPDARSSTNIEHLWRGLEERADPSRFAEWIERAFPDGVDPITRRQFLGLMGASLALAGSSGCTTRLPTETIVPYVRQPEGLLPGKPLYYATAMTVAGMARGVLVESHEGRPIKIEGNRAHPASLGATDAWAQASVLTLYDPDRAQTTTYQGRPRSFDDLLPQLKTIRERRGQGLRILTETITSPALAEQLRTLLQQLPEARWHAYEPAATDAAREGSRLAFGQIANSYYDLTKADVIVALDADFLSTGAAHLRYVRQFTDRRRERPTLQAMNRLYAVEPVPSPTGMIADHRLPMRARDVARFIQAMATRLEIGNVPAPSLDAAQTQWLAALVQDLLFVAPGRRRAPGTTLVIPGEGQPAAVHVLAHALNHKLGNLGKTVLFTAPVEAQPAELASLTALATDMHAGKVETLLVLSGNPVYTAPADLEFAAAMRNVGLRIHLGLYADETAALCHWHLPEAHYLETWGDARAFDGTASVVQPLIAPLYGGRSAHEVLAAVAGQPGRSAYETVRATWRQRSGAGFESFWRRALHDGVVPNTAFPPVEVRLQADWAARAGLDRPAPAERGLEIVFRPDPTIFDGRFANNGWLQELPKPLTQLTWDNAALMSPATARELGIGNPAIGNHGGAHGEIITDLVELHYQGRMVRAPAWIMPGHADGSITVHLGHGRERAGTVGTGVGFNAYRLRTATAPNFDAGLEVRPTGERYVLACTQYHHTMQGRDPVRVADLETYRTQPNFVRPTEHEADLGVGRRRPLPMYPDTPPAAGPQWGMAIDLNACVGCGACVVACQAENNIPVVGKAQVTRGREMHWLRIDRYFDGEDSNPTAYFQPVPCMHCETAPCEIVCPVEATSHSPDGLNEMTYNRCVGTRYCSNNCPYKVRRFNFLAFADYATSSLKLLRNPTVTVRSRGVMEKCTYCVQRIREAEIDANNQGRPLRDGDIVTACQAACPAQAIVFGNVSDPASAVARLKASPRNYGLLEELNTRPRTTYLAVVRNLNRTVADSGRSRLMPSRKSRLGGSLALPEEGNPKPRREAE